VGLVLGLRFAHSLGLPHGHLTGNNILFDADGIIQITDFCLNSLANLEGNEISEVDIRGFSSEGLTAEADIGGFSGILSEIAIGAFTEQSGCSSDVPSFVSEMIAKGQSADSNSVESFADILKALKRHDFKIMESVDIKEVSDFVRWIEWSEVFTA
jgi:tRNA A-37 threonylcarbamoyl transferase component Bud32